MMPQRRYRLEYWAALALAGLVSHLPLNLGWLLGTVLGQMAFSLFRVRRQVTLDNLRHAFPQMRRRPDLVKIGARCYRNLGRGLVEFCHFPMLTGENIGRLLHVQGMDYVRWALDQGRGAILLSGHFGAWEFLGPAFALNGFDVDLFVRSQKNPLFDQLMNQYRIRVGSEIIRASRTPRSVLRSLHQNRLLVMLADQDGGRDGVFVPFMGRAASTPRGVARFAIHTGAPVLMGFVMRQADGRHHLIVDPPIAISSSGDPEDDLYQILSSYTHRLEKYVRDHPDQWFWPHRRWKTRPPGENAVEQSEEV